jgi:hypothetical protein
MPAEVDDDKAYIMVYYLFKGYGYILILVHHV